MDPSSPADQDERVESLPWERLAAPDGGDRRRMTIVAVAVVIAAVTASATRTLWPSPPLAAPPTTSMAVSPAVTQAAATPTTVAARLLTEADLRAISPDDATRAVAAHAQWFVTEWLTIDGEMSSAARAMVPEGTSVTSLDESARSFVESAIVTSVSEVGEAVWEASVLVRSLSAFGEGGYMRVPARVFLVTVAIGEDGPFVLDVPTPGPLPVATSAPLDLVDEQAPAGVIAAAIDVMGEGGLVDEASVRSQRSAALWRVSGVVRDDAGVPVMVAVWTDHEGGRVPAPRVP